MKQGSLVNTICEIASGHTTRYERMAKEELEETGRIRFRLTPHVSGGWDGWKRITHWHIRHIRSYELFIVRA